MIEAMLIALVSILLIAISFCCGMLYQNVLELRRENAAFANYLRDSHGSGNDK